MSVLVIDYGMGNLGSVRRSFEECGANILVSNNPNDIKYASHIVLPGVGAFADGMENLQKNGWVEALQKAAMTNNTPLIGICLGMQLLADKSDEGGAVTQGLGLISGEVVRLQPQSENERVPHVGWNETHIRIQHLLYQDIPDKSDFYFVHSFQFVPINYDNATTTTPFCGKFVSTVIAENICGVQFHPEKSSRVGLQLIKNFLQL